MWVCRSLEYIKEVFMMSVWNQSNAVSSWSQPDSTLPLRTQRRSHREAIVVSSTEKVSRTRSHGNVHSKVMCSLFFRCEELFLLRVVSSAMRSTRAAVRATGDVHVSSSTRNRPIFDGDTTPGAPQADAKPLSSPPSANHTSEPTCHICRADQVLPRLRFSEKSCFL